MQQIPSTSRRRGRLSSWPCRSGIEPMLPTGSFAPVNVSPMARTEAPLTPYHPPSGGRDRDWRSARRSAGKHAEAGHELGVLGGLAALSLDALASVAYGPEAMVLVLITAGTGALSDTVPLTLVITGMLGLLVISYSQVIEAHPEGGGAYSVAKANLGRWPSLLAAAAVVVDYVLTVAVSLAAGAASLGSVFPGMADHLLLISLIALVILTAVNMFGIAASSTSLPIPALIFI